MAKRSGRKAKKGVVMKTLKRGAKAQRPEETFKKFLRLARKVRNPNECLAQRAARAAVCVSSGKAPTSDQIETCGEFLFRCRDPADVVVAHILHREGRGDLDGKGVYTAPVPWASGRIRLCDALEAAFAHTCFKATAGSAGSKGLKVDKLTEECRRMLRAMVKGGYNEHEQRVAVILASYSTSSSFGGWLKKCFQKHCTIETAVRSWSRQLPGASFLGPVGKGPRRNRHSAKLKAEDIFALLCRLDRASDLGDLWVLEETLRSDLMFPHVVATLRELDLLGACVGPGVTSSTNVRLLHRVFLSLDRASKSRMEWIEEVTAAAMREVVALSSAHRDRRTQQFLAAVQEQLDIYSTAWVLCKVGTVLQVALGGTTQLRSGFASPVRLLEQVRRKCA